jgi:LemA protein
MKKSTIVWLVILAIVVLVVGSLWSFYNNVITKDQAVKAQWAQVENQYQRRFDLIPNLVNLVKLGMAQEQKVFSDITDARTKYSGAQNVDEKVQAANQLEGAIGRLLVVMENYPQIKSIEAVQQAMAELAGTENRVAVERGRFNEQINGFNNLVIRFPGNVLANIFGFSQKTYFEAAEGSDKAPQINPNL